MRRVSPSIPVPANMLRHFAVLTIVITAGIAMFASGETQSALVEQVKQRQTQTEAARAERQRATQHTVVVDGLRIAPGTKLGDSPVEPEGRPATNEVPLNPQAMADFPQRPGAPTGPATPPDATGRSAKGGPPPPAMMMRMPGKPGQPAAKPGQASQANQANQPHGTEQEVNAMIEASVRRAGTAKSE